MADACGDGVSDGSDIEVDRGEEEDFFAHTNGEDEVEVHDEEMNEFARQIFQTDSEGEEDFQGFQYTWRTAREHFETRRTRAYSKNRSLVPGVRLPENKKAIDYFFLFWNEDMWNLILRESNRYAEQQRRVNPPPPSFAEFREINLREMKTFIGLCLMMGILRLPKRSDYWRTKKSCWLAHTNFGKAMSRNRFDIIWRYLHLQNNMEQNPGDKLFKVRPYLNILLQNFRETFIPGAAYTVDESMVKFKGRLGIRQYLPCKPIKWGVKIWTLAESQTGYVLNFQIYTGRENQRTEHGLSHQVVLDMCRMLQGTQAQVYFDNFFTTVKLMNDLHHLNIQACGTVRANRKGLPENVVPKKGRRALHRHQFQMAQRDNLTFAHWQDTKPVCVLSNFHDPTAMGSVRRRVNNERQQVAVPACLADYQKNMKGVDLCDQMVGYFLLNHRSWKWWRRIFFHLMMVSVHNGYIVAKHHDADLVRREWPEFQDFVEAVAHDLVTVTVAREAPVPEAPTRATLRHDIQKIFGTKKVCKVCSRKADSGERRRVTCYGCVQCQEACHSMCLIEHIRHQNAVVNNVANDEDVMADVER